MTAIISSYLYSLLVTAIISSYLYSLLVSAIISGVYLSCLSCYFHIVFHFYNYYECLYVYVRYLYKDICLFIK